MPIYTQTVEAIKRDVARSVGGLIYNGTADSGTASTLVHDELKRFKSDDALNGKQIDIVGGVNIGEDLTIDDFTASSGTITVVPNWTTTVTSTSRYHIYDPTIVTARWLEELIAEAVDSIARHRLTAVTNRKLILNDLLQGDGDMETYTTTNVPDNWTLDANSTFTKETGAAKVRFGSSSLKVVTDGTNVGTATHTVEPHYRYDGHEVTAKCWVWTATASRVFLRVDEETESDSSNHGGDSKWEQLSKTASVADPDTLSMALRVSSGGAVTAYYDHARLITGTDLWTYTLPTSIRAVSEIYVEGSTEDQWSHVRIPESLWELDRSNTLLIINRRKFAGYGDRRLHIKGLARLDIPDSDDDAVDVPSYVKAYCIYHILDHMKGVSVERLGFAKRVMDEERARSVRLPTMKNLRWFDR